MITFIRVGHVVPKKYSTLGRRVEDVIIIRVSSKPEPARRKLKQQRSTSLKSVDGTCNARWEQSRSGALIG